MRRAEDKKEKTMEARKVRRKSRSRGGITKRRIRRGGVDRKQ